MIEKVSPVKSRDAAISLSELHRREKNFTSPALSRKMKHHDYIAYIYRIGMKAVALCSFVKSNILQDDRFIGKYELAELFVLPEHRRQGIGTELLRYSLDEVGSLCQIDGALILLIPISEAVKNITTREIVPKYSQVCLVRDMRRGHGCVIKFVKSENLLEAADKLRAIDDKIQMGNDSVSASSAFPMSPCQFAGSGGI